MVLPRLVIHVPGRREGRIEGRTRRGQPFGVTLAARHRSDAARPGEDTDLLRGIAYGKGEGSRYKTTLSEQYGHVQPEYVVVPDALGKTAELRRYFEISYTYVSSLRPKATTKKKPAAKQRRKQ